MGLFGGVEKAEVVGGGVYFLPGVKHPTTGEVGTAKYRIKVREVKAQRSQRHAKDFFIIETEILRSQREERAPGSKASQVIEIGNVMGPVNIKAFVAAASGVDPTSDGLNEALIKAWFEMTEVTMSIEQICERVIDSDNPLEGLELDLECAEILTREKKTPFTKHFWSPVSDAFWANAKFIGE